MTKIINGYEQFTDKNGEPLENGYVYIGTYGREPETNPINIYYDAGLIYDAPNPVRTINGYISRNGSPSNLFTSAEQYSVKVEDVNRGLIYSNLFVDQTLSPSQFNDTVHGDRGGGSLHSDATVSADGFMTTAQVTKLDGIEALAEVNNMSDSDAAELTGGGVTTKHSHPESTNLNIETFTASGTFTVPAGITSVKITGVGGGGGGAGGGRNTLGGGGGGGGGGARWINDHIITGLTPLDNLTITLNTGGTGGAGGGPAADGNDGGAGGSVIFDDGGAAQFTIAGGSGGIKGLTAGTGGAGGANGAGSASGNGGAGGDDGVNGSAGSESLSYTGGGGGTGTAAGGGGGGGGASPYGNGGAGGSVDGGNGTAAAATAYGAAGGGGAGGQSNNGGTGGSGASGILIISW